MVELAFLDREVDVRPLAGPVRPDQRQTKLPASDVHDIGLHIGDTRLQVSALAVVIGDRDHRVVLHRIGVVALWEDFLEEDRVRDPHALGRLHVAAEFPEAEGIVALHGDLPDLHLGTFRHVQRNRHRRRRQRFHLRLDLGELAALFGQVRLQHVLRPPELGVVKLGFHAEADIAFPEPIQNVGGRNGLDALKLQRTDCRTLLQDKPHDPAHLPALPLQTDVVEAALVPQRDQVALQRGFAINVAHPREDRVAQRQLRDAPGAPELDGFDPVGGLGIHRLLALLGRRNFLKRILRVIACRQILERIVLRENGRGREHHSQYGPREPA